MIRNGVVIVAAGKGLRMKTSLPKQFLLVRDKPILVHSIEKFLAFDPEIEVVLVLGKDDHDKWNQIKEKFLPQNEIAVAYGGAERYDSVGAGLAAITKSDVVGIHDAVRPCVDLLTIQRTFKSAAAHGSGIPVVELKDSIRKIDGKASRVVNRRAYRIVQTPQTFNLKDIKNAYNNPIDQSVTDDASVYETAYGKVNLVEGNYENIKITTRVDLQLAEILLKD